MWLFSLMMFTILTLLGILTGITPLISRQATPFGVTFPPELLRHDTINLYKKKYVIWNIGISTVMAIPILFIPVLLDGASAELWGSIYSAGAMIVFIVVSFGLYLYIRNRLLKWKSTFPAETFVQPKKVVVDLQFHEKLATIGQGTFLICQLLIVGVTIAIAFANYTKIPEQIPINWGANFEVNRYVTKQPLTVLALPGIQVLMIPMFQFSYYSFIRSRQKLSPLAPELSSKKSLLFRQAWARFFFWIAILTQLLISSLYLFSLFASTSDFIYMVGLILLYLFFTLGASFYLSFKYGQSGEKLHLSTDNSPDERYYFDSEEDTQWIAGVFYYNPNDPAVFVEKRFGIGTTLNMARWQSWLVVAGLIIFIAASLIWSILLT